jgi:hypothetical protein
VCAAFKFEVLASACARACRGAAGAGARLRRRSLNSLPVPQSNLISTVLPLGVLMLTVFLSTRLYPARHSARVSAHLRRGLVWHPCRPPSRAEDGPSIVDTSLSK